MGVIAVSENLSTTSGLSNLLHGVISLPDATEASYVSVIVSKLNLITFS